MYINVQCTLYTLYIVHCTVYNALLEYEILHCIVYSVQSRTLTVHMDGGIQVANDIVFSRIVA